MEVFDIVRKTLFALISDATDSDDYLEKLAEISGLIKPEVVATSFQLAEKDKVRELLVPLPEIKNRARKFEDFQEKPTFDWKSEWRAKNRRKEQNVESWEVISNAFVEVEHYREKESFQFFYPRIHYCPCHHFQVSVLENQSDWICVHLLAFYFSRSFGKMQRIHCKREIIGIVRKFISRAVIQ